MLCRLEVGDTAGWKPALQRSGAMTCRKRAREQRNAKRKVKNEKCELCRREKSVPTCRDTPGRSATDSVRATRRPYPLREFRSASRRVGNPAGCRPCVKALANFRQVVGTPRRRRPSSKPIIRKRMRSGAIETRRGNAKCKMKSVNCKLKGQGDAVNADLRRLPGCGEWSADWKSAIQQVRNLRYKEAAL
jgi:hypothetical protein